MKLAGRMLSDQIEFWYLAGSLILALVLAGGYLQPSAALLCIFMGAVITAGIWKRGKIVFSCDLHAVTFFLSVFLYLVTGLWAVDRGMAFGGFIHFLPVFLFYMLLCRNLDKKEKLITLLPLLGSLMTLFSFVMMQFPVFQDYVSVAGRLSGFFQYPNTYALFMLVCLIVSAYRLQNERLDWLDILYCCAAVFGIYMSGSRTTFVLLLGVLAWFFIRREKIRKIVLPAALLGLALVQILWLVGITDNLFERLFDLSLQSSTLLGRLLYVQDAVKLVLKHPFGCGFYGYYFLQTEIQTGVYSVVNVHNEFVQMMLDIGIIPAFLFYGTMLVTVFRRNVPGRDRLAVLVIIFHSLLDYDFQFPVMYFVLMLFLDIRKVKQYPVSMLTKAVSAAAFAAAAFGAVRVGASDLLMMNGQYEEAVQIYGGNTLAKVYSLTEIEDTDKLQKRALSIAEVNQHVPLAYHALAQAALANGKVQEYLGYKEYAIKLAPYDINAYMEYLDALSYCLELYRSSDEDESVEICSKKIGEVPEMLEQLKDKTSWLGWQIDDAPEVELPQKYEKIIDEMM